MLKIDTKLDVDRFLGLRSFTFINHRRTRKEEARSKAKFSRQFVSDDYQYGRRHGNGMNNVRE